MWRLFCFVLLLAVWLPPNDAKCKPKKKPQFTDLISCGQKLSKQLNKICTASANGIAKGSNAEFFEAVKTDCIDQIVVPLIPSGLKPIVTKCTKEAVQQQDMCAKGIQDNVIKCAKDYASKNQSKMKSLISNATMVKMAYKVEMETEACLEKHLKE